MSSTIGATFPASEGVGDRIHSFATDMRFSTHVPFSTCFSEFDILMFGVTDLAESGSAGCRDHSHFAAGQGNLGPSVIFGCKLGSHAGRADQFASLSEIQFNIVDGHPRRYSRERQAVAGSQFRLATAGQDISN